MLGPGGHTHAVQEITRARLGLGLGHTIGQLRDDDVFQRGELG